MSRLADALATYARNVRAAIDAAAEAREAGTSEVFSEVSRGPGKQLWLVETREHGSE